MRMTSKIRLLVTVSLLFLIMGCASSWKGNAVTAYEATGLTIAEIGGQAKQMCESGVLKSDDCVKIKTIYNKTRLAYMTAGNALIAAIQTQDALTREKNMAAYQKAITEISALIPQLVKLAGEMGVIK